MLHSLQEKCEPVEIKMGVAGILFFFNACRPVCVLKSEAAVGFCSYDGTQLVRFGHQFCQQWCRSHRFIECVIISGMMFCCVANCVYH